LSYSFLQSLNFDLAKQTGLHVLFIPDGDGHRSDSEIHMLSCAEIDWNKRKPNNAGCVHWESDELGLIKSLRNLASQDSIDCADDHQQYWIGEGYHVTGVDGSLEKKYIKRKW